MTSRLENNAIILIPQPEDEDEVGTKLIELKLNYENGFTESVENNLYQHFKPDSKIPVGVITLMEDMHDEAPSKAEIGVEMISTLMLNCLICNKTDCTKSANGLFNIFNDDTTSNFTRTNLSRVLSEILQKEISKENIHSEYICSSCSSLLDQWDHFSTKLKTIKTSVTNTFYDTCERLKREQEREREKQLRNYNLSEGGTNFRIRTKRTKTRLREDASNAKFFEPNLTTGKLLFRGVSAELRCREEKNPPHARNQPRVCDIGKTTTKMGEETKIKGLCSEEKEFVNSEGAQKCDACNFESHSSSLMQQHRNSHFCIICGAFLSFPSQMKTHLVKVHNYSKDALNRTKLFQCNICFKKYSSSGSLHNHKKTVHNSSIYTCRICGQIFKHPRILSNHLYRHGEKKVDCTECYASFYLRAELNRHVNEVHRKIRAYECPTCNRFFCQRSSLTHHMSQHTTDEEKLKNKLHVQSTKNDEGVFIIGRHEGGSVTRTECISDTPLVSLDLDLATQPIESIDEKDEVEINLNFSEVTHPFVSPPSHVKPEAGQRLHPQPEMVSSNSFINTSSSVSQTSLPRSIISLDSPDTISPPNVAFLVSQDILYGGTFDETSLLNLDSVI